ncbi:hypothetical protein FQ192_11830 [Pseudomonas sp. ANT_J12]|jgi:hypothetical protein|uniref:hypothetical protein n=1 Tax=Pseudomonas sp. ANT_J12 TaxID=2597351 RepID=UPI0011F3C698|nr:hypothetical protein [Pseudomonas sp. ANT_J12]KAA0994812.1 hypothetical protein FQ192_11830 [Pseudomonas sp. ANT_J12]
MKFQDIYVNREELFSIGIEETSGRFYVSFPVSNGMVDYEEYYEIDRASFELFQKDIDAAVEFVMKCRRRELDELLIEKPGTNRGSAI